MADFVPDGGAAGLGGVTSKLSSLESSIAQLGRSIPTEETKQYTDALYDLQIQTGMNYSEISQLDISIRNLSKSTKTYRSIELAGLIGDLRKAHVAFTTLGGATNQYIKTLTVAFPRGAQEANRSLIQLQQQIPNLFIEMKKGTKDIGFLFDILEKGGQDTLSFYLKMLEKIKDPTMEKQINQLSQSWVGFKKTIEETKLSFSSAMGSMINDYGELIAKMTGGKGAGVIGGGAAVAETGVSLIGPLLSGMAQLGFAITGLKAAGGGKLIPGFLKQGTKAAPSALGTTTMATTAISGTQLAEGAVAGGVASKIVPAISKALIFGFKFVVLPALLAEAGIRGYQAITRPGEPTIGLAGGIAEGFKKGGFFGAARAPTPVGAITQKERDVKLLKTDAARRKLLMQEDAILTQINRRREIAVKISQEFTGDSRKFSIIQEKILNSEEQLLTKRQNDLKILTIKVRDEKLSEGITREIADIETKLFEIRQKRVSAMQAEIGIRMQVVSVLQGGLDIQNKELEFQGSSLKNERKKITNQIISIKLEEQLSREEAQRLKGLGKQNEAAIEGNKANRLAQQALHLGLEKTLNGLRAQTSEYQAQTSLIQSQLSLEQSRFTNFKTVETLLAQQTQRLKKELNARKKELKEALDPKLKKTPAEIAKAELEVSQAQIALREGRLQQISAPFQERTRQINVLEQIKDIQLQTLQLNKTVPPSEMAMIFREQISLAKNNISVFEQELMALRASGQAGSVMEQNKMIEIAQSNLKLVSLQEKFRRSWEEQFTQLTMNLTTGTTLFKSSIAPSAQFGPTFQKRAGGGISSDVAGFGTFQSLRSQAGIGDMRGQQEKVVKLLQRSTVALEQMNQQINGAALGN